MTIERRFLGWHRPALHLAVDFLFEEFAHGAHWDMGEVIVALPGARAGRRLRELLAIRAAQDAGKAERCLLTPPRIITAGDLPETLYEPPAPIATELESLMAWAESLQKLDRAGLQALHPGMGISADVGRRPGAAHDDTRQRLGFAAEMAAIELELAAGCVSPETLADYCQREHFPAGALRWKAFARLTELYDQALEHMGRVSRRAAREDAVGSSCAAPGLRPTSARLATGRTVVLIGTADLPAITGRLLQASPSRTIALIHAPADHAWSFDDVGRLASSFREDNLIPLEDSQVEIADYPRDQARRAAETLASLSGVPSHFVSVALAEESLASPMERALARAGRPVHRAAGTPLAMSAPARLLSALAAYYGENRAEDFAALLRHPDLTDWLARELSPGEPPAPWLDLCDNYLSERLPITIVPGGKLFAPLDRAARAISDLAGSDPRESRPIAEQAERIAAILARIYPAEDGASNTSYPALTMLHSALTDLARISVNEANDSHLLRSGGGARGGDHSSLPEAIGLLLATTAAYTTPAPAGAGKVELIGWLEAHLDDSPILLIAGFNEGAIPQSVVSDSFLSDSMRCAVGLVDNRQRYARDAYLLRAVLASRQMVRIICGRFGAGNVPLAPSRLLLACEPDQVVARVLAFYAEPKKDSSALPAQMTAKPYSLATIPRPHRAAKPIGKLRVTDFKDYLQCPYRFYLKHVLGLVSIDDLLVEMSPNSFGDIVHKVLQEFGRWVVEELLGKPPTDAEPIEWFLLDRLAALARQRHGDSMHPAVAVQVELLAERLKAFARFQASDFQAGWTIISAERKVVAQIDVDDVPFIVEGRVDRIDYNPASLRYRILDYKSSDSGGDPEKTHRAGEEWIDLQLPLYRRIASVMDIPAGAVDVGFITLPRDLQRVRWEPAPWDDDLFEEADFKADEVIRKVRAQEFWPPGPNPPTFEDGLAAICLDTALDRETIIRAEYGPEAVWPFGEEAVDGG